jgi:hypothetical protein
LCSRNTFLKREKNKAKESERSYQLCLQLFYQEEFPHRLETHNTVPYCFRHGRCYCTKAGETKNPTQLEDLIAPIVNTYSFDYCVKKNKNFPDKAVYGSNFSQ